MPYDITLCNKIYSRELFQGSLCWGIGWASVCRKEVVSDDCITFFWLVGFSFLHFFNCLCLHLRVFLTTPLPILSPITLGRSKEMTGYMSSCRLGSTHHSVICQLKVCAVWFFKVVRILTLHHALKFIDYVQREKQSKYRN